MAARTSDDAEPAAALAAADGPWWFHGVFVYDGASDELAEFFEKNIHDLDRATGIATTFSTIGDPRIAGKEYERRRTPETIGRQLAAAKEYRRLVVERGDRGHHRRRETDDLIDQLGIARTDLPCVAFLTSPRYDPAPILKLDRLWLSTPNLRLALRDALMRYLAEDQILVLGQPGKATTAELVQRLSPILESIRAEMEFAESAAASRGAQRPLRSMPVPPGATWAQVQIKFVDGHTVDVTVPGKRAVLSHDHMGFVDRRSGRPNKQWDLLRALASCHGDVRWTDLRVRGRYEKRVQELSQALRTFFRLGDAPLKLDSKNHRWQARFSVLPED